MEFSYFLPTKIVFGFGKLPSIATEVASLKVTKPLVVTDKTMVKTGTVDRVITSIKSAEVFDGVEPEPSIEVAQAVATRVRSGRYDGVIGVGGGSSMDMAKVASAFATNSGDARDYVGNNLFKNGPLPSIMVPTTAGTGAELTVTSMVTVDGHKQWINSPLLLPSVALVDPELTMTMPKNVTAATGLDALCHCVESYFSNLSNVITDAAALKGVSLIVGSLSRAYEDGTDKLARQSMSLGALLGGVALHARMVYGHSIGYTLATRYKLAHGVSCGLPLPYVIANYSVACGPKMAGLAEAYGLKHSGEDPVTDGREVAERTLNLVKLLGVPSTLKDIGVEEADLSDLAKECLETYSRPNSPLVFDAKSMTHFYRMIWEGRLY
ncbi:MAG TPA: iron-containing alcohol dehydrogenase [Nitrososphaerales archaeon]|nr:iron-containing alcohol dehydrogenase [Nitrososphaerales archaeon]